MRIPEMLPAYRRAAATVLFLVILFGGGVGAWDLVIKTDLFSEITEKKITLKWKVEGELLRVIISAPTTGWVSVGFAPEREMKGANIIIGYVKNGTAFLRDDYGDGNENHQSDATLGGSDNVSSQGGNEVNGVTEVSFAIPLNSGDRYDRKLIPGNSYKVILAYGPDGSDNFDEKHRRRVRTKIEVR